MVANKKITWEWKGRVLWNTICWIFQQNDISNITELLKYLVQEPEIIWDERAAKSVIGYVLWNFTKSKSDFESILDFIEGNNSIDQVFVEEDWIKEYIKKCLSPKNRLPDIKTCTQSVFIDLLQTYPFDKKDKGVLGMILGRIKSQRWIKLSILSKILQHDDLPWDERSYISILEILRISTNETDIEAIHKVFSFLSKNIFFERFFTELEEKSPYTSIKIYLERLVTSEAA